MRSKRLNERNQEKNKIDKKKILMILVVIIFALPLYVQSVKALESFTITLTPNTEDYGSVTLDWSTYNYANKNYKVYKSTDNGSSWNTVGIDYKLVDEVKVLQIYPRVGNNLKSWMNTSTTDENGNATTIGRGIIKVDECTINQFNADPDKYLGTSSSGWKYDVIVFGFWDGNNALSASEGGGTIDLTTNSRGKVENFIKAGKGVLFGHDVVVGYNPQYRTNYNWLADKYLGVSVGTPTSSSSKFTYVKIHKKGLFSTYPWYIGEEGDVIGPIKETHDWSQLNNGADIFLTGVKSDGSKLDYSINSVGAMYLVVNNNTAQIQTGHSNGESTDIERKILANTIFYLNQLLFNTYTTRDSSAQDLAAPNSPSVAFSGLNANLSAIDNGTPYYYYVESYSKDDTTSAGLLARSNTESVTVTTGVVGYRYYFDNNSTGTVTRSHNYVSGSTVPLDTSKTYLHVAAVDGAGNLGATTSVKVALRQIVKARYENGDGTFTAYQTEMDKYYAYGDTVSWSRPADATYQAASITPYTVTEAKTTKVTVYRNKYSVTLNKGIGISNVSGADTYRVGQPVSIDATVKTGYTWKNWTGTFTVSTKSHTFTMPTNAVTLTANAKPNTYYVAYYKGTTNNGGTTSTSTHTYDADVTLRANGFTGRSYTLAFNENKPKDDKGVTTAGTVANLQSNKIGTLQFNKWYITNAHNNNKTNAAAGKNLGAKNYRNDHKGTASATAQWQSVTLKDYSTPSLLGYKFNGYFTAASGGTKTTTITVDPATTAYSETLYAQWTPITYKVRFNGNGNWNTSQGSYTQTLTYDTHTALTANKFTRADNTTYSGTLYKIGYEFVGWGTSPNQTTPTYTDGQIVNNLTATDGEIIDLYAIWKKTVTLTINFNGGKYKNDGTSKVLSYTMYNSELNHTFDISQYYGTQIGTGYYDKGLNLSCIKNVDNVSYRFLGYSLNRSASIPDEQFDTFAYENRMGNCNIKDDTTLYAIWEPVLQMTASLSTSEGHSVPIQSSNIITIINELGNFIIPSGTKNTALPNDVTAYTKNEFTKINTVNSATVSYTISAKGGSNITFGMAADERILDIYTNGTDNTWYDILNQETDFLKVIDSFTTVTDDFRIPKYLGTTQSHPSSNPNSADSSKVYGIKFTCTQPSYYYEKYWNTDESISIYGVIFLEPAEMTDSEGDLPEYGDFNFQTILN